MNDDAYPGLRFAREAVCKSTTQGEYDLNARLLGELLHPLTPEIRDVYESNPGMRFARVAVLKSTEEGEYAIHARVFQDWLQTRVQSQPDQGNTSSPGAVNDETAAVPTKKWCSKGENCVHEGGPEQPLANFGRNMGRIRSYCRSCRNEGQQHYRSSAAGTTRFRWTAELHAQFVTVINEIENTLGPGMVTTGSIFKRMEIPGLTYAQVNSHLQKYRQKKLVDQRQNGEAPLGDEDEVETEEYAGGMFIASPERVEEVAKTAEEPSRVVDPEVQAEVDALAVQIMEAAEQRKKNKDRLELLLSTEDQRKNDQSEQTMYTGDPRETLHRLPPPSKRKYGTGSVVCRTTTSGRERWEAVIGQNKERKRLGMYDTKVEALNACDSYLEDPDGFVAPPLLRRRMGTGSVVCTTSCRWRVIFIQNKERKDLGLYDTKEEAENVRGRYLEDPGGFVAPPPSRRRNGTGSAVCRTTTSGRERWEAVIAQNKERKALGMYDTKVEALNACDSYLEDPDGFVVPPLLKRRNGTGSVKPSKFGRFTATYKKKYIGTFDTETEANDAIDAIRGTSKTDPATSSTSGLEELAMVAALEQPESSKRPRGDDEEDVEKFTEFEVGHLVFARVGKANWAPAQISAISTSVRGLGFRAKPHQVYDVEFFVKEKNGVYPRAQNLPLSKLEAADEDTFEKHSGRKESKNWVEGMEKFRRLYDKSRRV